MRERTRARGRRLGCSSPAIEALALEEHEDGWALVVTRGGRVHVTACADEAEARSALGLRLVALAAGVAR